MKTDLAIKTKLPTEALGPKGFCLKAWAPFLALVVVALSLSAVSLLVSPFPWGDEGGYINMLNSFFVTGKMDLMQWSQPTFLGVVPFAAPLALTGQSGLYSWCGIVASFLTMTGIFALTSRYTTSRNALLLSLSPLCQFDFVATIPTIMSDQFFLAYLVWSLVGIDRFVERRSGTSLCSSAIAFALSAVTRANGYLLLFGALLLSLRVRSAESRRLAIALLLISALIVVAVLMLTTNRIPLERSTCLPDVLIRHNFALFDLRATFKAFFETLFALTPALILVTDWKRVNRIDVGAAAVSFPLCINFCLKNVLSSPILHAPVWIALLWIPALVASLSCTIRSTQNKSYLFSLCCLVSLGSFIVMPIMSHPLTRHALPALIAMLVALAAGGKLKNEQLRYLCAGFVAIILVISNYVASFNDRIENKMHWEVGAKAISSGIANRDLCIDWGWFCAHDLIPGQIQNYDYVDVYHTRERSSKFLIVDGRLAARK